MARKLTNKMKGLLTLLTDKIMLHGYMCGAENNRNWLTQAYYDHNPAAEQIQGTLDRIGKAKYYKSPHVDEDKHEFFKPVYLGPDLYDHNIRFEWRELIGRGEADDEIAECLKGCYLQDKAGRWHPPCDTGMWIGLYHPNKQPIQERVHGRWLRKGDNPHWRPKYHYTRDEVIEALQIMCREFNWEFEDSGHTETMILRHHADE